MKTITIVLFALWSNAAIFGQSMITENSYLENEDGKEISYAIFVTKMDSGDFTMIPLQNDAKKVIGYKLKPLVSIKSISNKTNNSKIEIGEIIELDVIYRKHILIHVTFNSESESVEGWMIFDTGTFVPIIITNKNFKEKLRTIKSVELNGFEIHNPITGTYGFPEVIQQYNEIYTDEIGNLLGGKEIVGIMGYQLLNDYLVTIDLSKNKIYLRNQLTKEESISTNKTYRVNYRDDLQNIWLPVTINNIEGLAHLDTGYPYTWVEESIVKKEVDNFTIGGVDVFGQIDIKYKMNQQSQNYSNLKFPLIANIGNNFLSHFVLTIDSVNKQLSFVLIKE